MAFRKARAVANLRRGTFRSAENRSVVMRDSTSAYEGLAYSLIDLWDTTEPPEVPEVAWLQEAVDSAQEGRSRRVLDLLGHEVLAAHNAPPELMAKFRDLRHQVANLQRQLEGQPPPDAPSAPTAEGLKRLTFSGELAAQNVEGEVTRPAPSPTEAALGGAGLLTSPSTGGPELRQMSTSQRHSTRGPGALSDAPEIPATSETALSPTLDPRWQLLRETQTQKAQVLQAIQQVAPEFDPDLPVRPTDWPEAQVMLAAHPDTAVVEFIISNEADARALILSAQGVQCVKLPHLGTEAVPLAIQWLELIQRRPPASAPTETPTDYAPRFAAWEQAHAAETRSLLSRISQLAIHPLLPKLGGFRKLVLDPHFTLHLLPLHACPLPDSPAILADAYEISYGPSLSLLHLTWTRSQRSLSAKTSPAQPPLLISNPTADLMFTAALEAATLTQRFPDLTHLQGNQADKATVLAQSPGHRIWHYSGHAYCNFTSPMESGLQLSKGESLPLKDVFTRLNLHGTELTVANGCQTSMAKPEAADDYVNFATGFIFAGAQSVVSTLWSVFDVSAALLMLKFYEEWQDHGRSIPAAMREAQRWLRQDIRNGEDLYQRINQAVANLPATALAENCRATAMLWRERKDPPFASPVHWAAHTVSGLAW